MPGPVGAFVLDGGVSIPIAGWGRTVVYRWTGSAVAVRGWSGTTCIVRAPNAEQFSEWT